MRRGDARWAGSCDAYGVARLRRDRLTLAQHQLHLELREARAQAAPAAAPERDPRVRARWVVEESLRPEGVGVGIDRRIVMQQVGVRHDADARRISPAADLDRLLHEPWRGVR